LERMRVKQQHTPFLPTTSCSFSYSFRLFCLIYLSKQNVIWQNYTFSYLFYFIFVIFWSFIFYL
jgi:uncharacterized protein YybS (DUF2232 family)